MTPDLSKPIPSEWLAEFEAAAGDRRVEVEGFPVCHPDDIIASKEAAGRARDLESLPRLRSFRDYWKGQR